MKKYEKITKIRILIFFFKTCRCVDDLLTLIPSDIIIVFSLSTDIFASSSSVLNKSYALDDLYFFSFVRSKTTKRIQIKYIKKMIANNIIQMTMNEPISSRNYNRLLKKTCNEMKYHDNAPILHSH